MIDYTLLFQNTKTMSVLVAEDYQPLREDLSEILTDLFDQVAAATNGEEALILYQKKLEKEGRGFDLLITDIQMPLMNGIVLCEKVREMNPDQEVVVLSAHTDSNYLLQLIECGISKFLSKPIDQQALMKALFHVSSRQKTEKSESDEKRVIELGDGFVWNSEKGELLDGYDPVELTRYEYLLFLFLTEKNGQICTNEAIIDYFYQYNIELHEKSIRNFIFKLRKKLPEDLIQSIYGMGYKLNISY
ncbi:MAG TPA: response regulator transcription factor [Epsilonproteobacteria bacterium]|nr:response regulator transcription factor [Campylobacterota bacterium]